MRKILAIGIMVLMLGSYMSAQSTHATEIADQESSCVCGEFIPTAEVTSDDELYLTENYATYYFSNLTNNFGNNTHGSCTQIAFAMVLSYYDTYLDDSFIPEVYDEVTHISNPSPLMNEESPGILREPESVVNTYMNAATYKSAVLASSSDYFHLNLLKLDISIGHYNDNDDDGPCGMTRTALHNLMNAYMYGEDYLQQTNTVLAYNYATSSVRSYIVEKVEDGIPVIIRMGRNNSDGTTSGHAMVAYDYDEANDEIYVHAGWLGYSHVKLSDLNYPNYWDATALDVSQLSHSCSNNFVYTYGGRTITYCSCEYEIHPAHHDHQYTYAKYSDILHTKTCTSCAHVEYGNHRFASGSSLVFKRCLDCGALINTGENPGTIQSEDDLAQTE